MIKYFTSSILSTVIGLLLVFFIGYEYTQTLVGAFESVLIAMVLSILEVSLSFDNAIVNALVLKEMTPIWRHRFLTWGMLIAVFGMRLILPLVIVSVLGHLNPIEALQMALFNPAEYAKIMLSAHLSVMAYGGSFLMMVCLKYFFDETKDDHWIGMIERHLVKMGRLEAIEIGLVLTLIFILRTYLPAEEQMSFILSGLAGVITYIIVDGLGSFLEAGESAVKDIQKASVGMFIYLEVLDASFSFDGVVGAFAITNNLLIIMIGLSIGAFFVRSLTLLFVDKDTLSHFVYLEHGAFYAIGSLATMMLLDPFLHFPEWLTGLVGAAFIIVSFVSSLKVRATNSN